MIKSLLIANRGEIACRIISTARKMGVRTIAVYSTADANARHVREADEAYWIGDAPVTDSYLRAGRILSVAKQAGADAIHPGYGFLSENADFADLTVEAGMRFVGPPSSAIRDMGLKDKAKEIMAAAGVPVVPGYHGRNQNADFLKRKAYEIGYPVLIKAVAGGGGKGMRRVDKALEFDDALEAARREAKSSFGNDDVLIEKFIASPRHIEIQVFADANGHCVHLFERDCSLQRRHQKVIEEAPAPGMNQALRNAMGDAACAAAKAVGYQGAGTVEFIVDGSGELSENSFYFMEMNTRLQVEHPVTEWVTGQDLVEWQIRVAQGEDLPLAQEDLALNGHAFEARIYAEDPANGFLPSTGKLVAADFGPASPHVRVDAGVETGDTITPYYDPMIAKLIVWGEDRASALAALSNRLGDVRIAGPLTNIGFLKALSQHTGFMEGKFDTGLIDNHLENLVEQTPIGPAQLATAIAVQFDQMNAAIAERHVPNPSSPWGNTDGFQISGERELDWTFALDGEVETRRVKSGPEGVMVFDAEARSGQEWVQGDKSCATYLDGEAVYLLAAGRQICLTPHHFELSEEGSANADGSIAVPMHGKIVGLTVAAGDDVEQGDILFSVEAMKMEHAVIAPTDGRVEEVCIALDQQVEAGSLAIRLEAADNEA